MFLELFTKSIFNIMMTAMGVEMIDININEGFDLSVAWDILTETKRWAHNKNYIVACSGNITVAILQQVMIGMNQKSSFAKM